MIAFLLNLPYTTVGFFLGLLSFPQTVSFKTNPYAILFKVRRLWWAIGIHRSARAMTIGHVILLGPTVEKYDLEHEVIHVQQFQRAPLIHPLLYQLESLKKGYRNNKYEQEAYAVAKNSYKEDK